jgi:hypothetical protein
MHADKAGSSGDQDFHLTNGNDCAGKARIVV